MKQTSKPWYEAAFEADYLSRYAHRSDQAAAAEVEFLIRVLDLPKAACVLDLCSGAGRHSRAFSAKGLRVVSLDLSMDLLRAGRTRQGLSLAVRSDVRWLPFPTASFDGVVNLFTSFGYFESEDDNFAVLHNASRVLRPGGVLVLDFLNLEPTLVGLEPRTERHVGRTRMIEQRHYDQQRGRLMKQIRIEDPDGPVRELQESVRAYAPHELAELLDRAGLKKRQPYGDLRGGVFDKARSPRCVWVARKD